MNKFTPIVFTVFASICAFLAERVWIKLRDDEQRDWSVTTVSEEILQWHARWRILGWTLILVIGCVALGFLGFAIYFAEHAW